MNELKRNHRRQSGFTLIEFMIAITLSLIVMAALSVMLVNSSRARDELQKANEQIENGRYAMLLLAEDLQHAGYLGDLNQIANPPPPITTKPNPCGTTLAALNASMGLHIQGHDDENDNGSAVPSCLTDVKANTDIVVVRRVSSCVRGNANCASVAGAPYFQSSQCNTETLKFELDTTIGNLDRTIRDCTTLADMRRYITRIYFVANNNVGSDGIPTLKRAELTTIKADGSSGALDFYIKPLVEGIENLQLEYGMDHDLDSVSEASDTDGTVQNFTADPDKYFTMVDAAATACSGPANSCSPENWNNVMAVKINLLARSTASTPGHVESKTYDLGRKFNNAANTVGPFTSASTKNFKRHVFRTIVHLHNPAGLNQ